MKIENKTTATIAPMTTAPAPAAVDADADATPLAAAPSEQAAKFEGSSALGRLLAPHQGGDSRVIVPAGGGTGLINNQSAIDAHSKASGDFTEARVVDGKTLYFTPAGARSVDLAQENAANNSGSFEATADPTWLESFFKGDLFAGNEQHSGDPTKKP